MLLLGAWAAWPTWPQLNIQLGIFHNIKKTPTKILLEDKIIQSACGEYHSIVMTEKGEIMSCGTNSYSALGHHRVDNKKRCKKFEKI